MSRHDYKVEPLTEQDICSVTVRLWNLLGATGQAEFPLRRALYLFCRQKLSKNGILKITTFRGTTVSAPARVVFKPEFCLIIDEERLELLYLECPETKWIVAHELGHIVLHDSHAKAFSSDPALRIKFTQPEYSAEDQADLFAYYLLMPDS
ncbi:MAG: ImmA/IrrE family metallo-endopeptidase, partial [Hyphomicrobiales bacterium]|nr:ImmA/IrrE family metallo-endopeptidase [Hyphomicrobiales bacterium]